MRRQQNVWIGGASLRDVDARIVSVSVEETENQIEETYGANAGRSGQRLMERRRIGKTVAVEFQVRELYDMAARDEVLDAVNGWAARVGYLEISARPGKRLLAPCRVFATAGKIRDYTGVFRLEFQADDSPFWEETSPARLTLTGAEAEGTLLMRGTWPGTVEASVKPTGGTLTGLSIMVTGADGKAASLTLSGVSVAQNTTVTIGYDDNGYLAIRAGGASLLDKRTAASSDELTASPGLAAVSLTANVAVSAEITGRGRWL